VNNHEWLTLPGEFKASIDRLTKPNGEQITNLGAAHLERADLRGADLRGAKVTREQLNTCESYEGAAMPDGTVHE
jgi:uncharacterized protein YjbI with pentapeptide repeats